MAVVYESAFSEMGVDVFGRQKHVEVTAGRNFLCQKADDPERIRTLAVSDNQVQLRGKDGSLEATWIARDVTVERAKVQPLGAMVSKKGLRLVCGGTIDLLFPKNKFATSYPEQILDQVLNALTGAGAKLIP